jgi:hypothetical protein
MALTCNLMSCMIVSLSASTKLFFCVTYLNSSYSFFIFNKKLKLICPAHLYPNEFSIVNLMILGDQLNMYIIDLCCDDEFSDIKGIASFV